MIVLLADADCQECELGSSLLSAVYEVPVCRQEAHLLEPCLPTQASSGMFGDQAAGFLGSCLPSGAILGSSIGLKGAGGAAMHKLDAQGLGWAPTVGNLCTLLCFVLGLALNSQLNEVGSMA